MTRGTRAATGRRPAMAAVKRAFDVLAASSLLVLSAPVLLAAAAMIKATSRGPVMFRQARRGRHGRPFTLYKFRTMKHRSREAKEVLPDDPEVTPVGRLLRRLKVDELPQLWNVLRGDMSVVGPRPDLPDGELDALGNVRLQVRPGLTGLAQVNGNIYLPWEERWKYDAAYVERMSIGLDLWVLWRTVFVVVLGEKRFTKPFSGRSAARGNE